MKADHDHRVPLSDEAVDVPKEGRELSGGDPDRCVFPGRKYGRPLSNMALLQVVRRVNVDGVVHGFRSTFSNWCAECTSFPDAVVDAALAHVVKNPTEASCKRTDHFGRRMQLMAPWGHYVTGAKSKVVQLRAGEDP